VRRAAPPERPHCFGASPCRALHRAGAAWCRPRRPPCCRGPHDFVVEREVSQVAVSGLRRVGRGAPGGSQCEVGHIIAKRLTRMPRIGIADPGDIPCDGAGAHQFPKDFRRATGEHCHGNHIFSLNPQPMCGGNTAGAQGSRSRKLTSGRSPAGSGVRVPGRPRVVSGQRGPGTTHDPQESTTRHTSLISTAAPSTRRHGHRLAAMRRGTCTKAPAPEQE